MEHYITSFLIISQELISCQVFPINLIRIKNNRSNNNIYLIQNLFLSERM
nr:MAG TPA: hypothetical protein [Caudoviricetes sp.]